LVIRDAQNRAAWLASAMESSLTAIERDLLRLSIQLLDKLAEAPSLDQADGTTANAKDATAHV